MELQNSTILQMANLKEAMLATLLAAVSTHDPQMHVLQVTPTDSLISYAMAVHKQVPIDLFL